MYNNKLLILLSTLTLTIFVQTTIGSSIELSESDIELKLNNKYNLTVDIKDLITNANGNLTFEPETGSIAKINPNQQIINADGNYTIEIEAVGAGHSVVNGNLTVDETIDKILFRVTVYKYGGLDVFSVVVGWIYFAAWSVSFYPQIYSNYKRKSVIGLNFDFLYLNIVGFTLYGIFNLGLYYSNDIKDEYFDRHPGGLNPVQVNDIVFALHAAFACSITIVQTQLYERGEQRVSTIARCILTFFAVGLLISTILAASKVIHWLDFLYYCSYVKLTITLIKYVPQAYMNYQRKSTAGWSIGNILLDFTGGTLSMLQMIVNSYNYDDWISIFGDLTKFGLGLFSVAFDMLFIVQHYVLYKHSRYEEK